MTIKDKKYSLDIYIKMLDDLLNQALFNKRAWFDRFEKEKDVEGFDKKNFQLGYEEDINSWFRNVSKILHDEFEEKYHYFHFVEPEKSLAMSFSHPLGQLTHAYEKHMRALEEIILRLDEKRDLVIRREIAEKEYGADILYKVTYSEHTREVKLNNILLATLHSDSKNANFFEYVFSRPNEPVRVADIEESTALSLAENIQDILRDLGFRGSIRKVFFPVATKAKILFTNPITKQYWTKNDLPVIKLKENETEREKARQNENKK